MINSHQHLKNPSLLQCSSLLSQQSYISCGSFTAHASHSYCVNINLFTETKTQLQCEEAFEDRAGGSDVNIRLLAVRCLFSLYLNRGTSDSSVLMLFSVTEQLLIKWVKSFRTNSLFSKLLSFLLITAHNVCIVLLLHT